MSINWSSIYTGPIGAILGDFTPNSFASLATQGLQQQVSQVQSQIKQDSSQISAWGTLQSDAQALAGDLINLSQPGAFHTLAASSTTDSVATAIDNGSASQGSYVISVGSVATPEVDLGSSAILAVTNPNATLTSGGSTLTGTFTIAVGSGSPVSVSLPASGTSLNGLAQLINQTPGIGVTAAVEQQANGNWVLSITANATDQAISYQDTSGSVLYDLGITGSSGGAAANVAQAASPAKVSFGSTFNSSQEITSATNSFQNLIPGVTVNVAQAGTTTISVTPNISGMTASVQKFVSDWNQWAADTTSLAEAGSVKASGGGTSYSYQANPNQVISSPQPQAMFNEALAVLGGRLGSGASVYQSLAEIGVSLQSNGTLKLNQSTLATALQQHPNAVATLFQNLHQTMDGSSLAVLPAFEEGNQSVAGQAIANLTSQKAQSSTNETMLQNELQNQEQQAIIQYGKWVNAVAKYAQENTMLTALFNPSGSPTNNGG